MPENRRHVIGAYFADSRPVLDVRYDIERRVKRLLPRDPEQPETLVFRGTSDAMGTRSSNTIELRLEAAFDTHNLYLLQLDFIPDDGRHEQTILDSVKRTIDGWTSRLTVAQKATGSPERLRQVVAETIAREQELAAMPHREEDLAAIRETKETILNGMRRGKGLFTAHTEGGTNIKWIQGRFVFQDYGESDEREEFMSDSDFLARLRKFYDWPASYEWLPHPPPEPEVWKFIERQLN